MFQFALILFQHLDNKNPWKIHAIDNFGSGAEGVKLGNINGDFAGSAKLVEMKEGKPELQEVIDELPRALKRAALKSEK